MEQKILDQTTMFQYLLGLLTEEDRTRLEETFFKNDEYFEELIALEADLIDDYVNDRLPDSFRIAFEERLKSNPDWKRRLGFAGALSRRTAGLRKKGFRPRHQSFRRAVLVGAAAALALFSIVVWQFIEQRRNIETLRAERRNADTTIRDIQTELTRLQARDQDLSRQLEEERFGRQQPDKSRAPASLIASFVLRAGLIRGRDDSARLIIAKSAQSVRLQLDLEAVGDYRSYRAALRTAAGGLVWSADMLRARTTDSGKAVVIDLPPQFLAPGNYEVELLGLVDAGKFEEVAYYNFAIQEK